MAEAGVVALVTQGLLARGMSREDVAKVMGGNVAGVLAETLPETSF